MSTQKYVFRLAAFLVISACVLQASPTDDASMLVEGIKKSDPQIVYTALKNGTIDWSACGEFDYLDFACCKLTTCIEKIEHYRAKHKKWQDRIGSDYDQDLVKQKMINYTTLSEKWCTLKKQVQYIVQLIAFYLGLSQANIEAIEDLAADVVEVVADVAEMVGVTPAAPAPAPAAK